MQSLKPSCKRCSSQVLVNHSNSSNYAEGFSVCSDCRLIMLNSNLYSTLTESKASTLSQQTKDVMEEG